MKTNTIILHLRARLMDENIDELKISDEFLLDCIKAHQNKLIAEFDQNITRQEFALKDEKRIKLQFEIVKIITAFLNGKELLLTSQSYALKHLDDELALMMINPLEFELSRASSGTLLFYACKKAELNNKADKLVLNPAFLNALVYSVLIDALGIENNAVNLQRAQFYLGLLQKEKEYLRGFYANLTNKTGLRSLYVKV